MDQAGSVEQPITEQQGRQYTCPECGRVFDSFFKYAGHRSHHARMRRQSMSDEGEQEGVEVGAGEQIAEQEAATSRAEGQGGGGGDAGSQAVSKPWEVEVIEEALRFLEERLPKVYGIEKYAKSIVESLRDNPAPLANPNALHAFIKSLAPRVHDSHLSVFVISPLYARFPNLPEAVARYMASGQAAVPYYTAPYGYQHQVVPYYQPLYAPYPMHPANPMPAYAPAAHPVYYYHPIYYPYHYYPPPPPRPPRTYKVIVDGQEIETDEAGFMAWQRFLQERRERELEIKRLEIEMKRLELEMKRMEQSGAVQQAEKLAQEKEEKYKLIIDTIKEAQKAVMETLRTAMQTEIALREEKHKAEMEALRRELEELKRRPGFVEELEHYLDVARRLGMSRTGRTAYDLLESLFDRIDQRFAQLISKIPSQPQGWSPRVTRSPTERARLAEETIRRLERAEELVELENEMLRLAAEIAAEQSARSARAERRSPVTEAATRSGAAVQPLTGEAGGEGGVSGGGEEARATATA